MSQDQRGGSSTPEQELARLVAERVDLVRRLGDLDARLEWLAAVRHDQLSRRVAAVEDALRQLQGGSAPPATPAGPPQGPAEGSAPSAAAQPRNTVAPRIVGERVTVDATPFFTSPEPEAPVAGSLDPGAHVLLTDQASGNWARIVFQNQLVWVDSAQLGPVPDGDPLVAAPPPAEQLAGGPMAAPAQTQPPERVPAWRRPGFKAKLVALAGAAVTLTGVALLLVLAAQYGMFGPQARTISAALLAVVLVGLSFVVRLRDPRNVGAPILAATGVAAAFLSVVTATVIYGWLPTSVGVGLTGVIGLGGMALARRWDNEWVSLVSVLGGLILAGFIGQHQELATAGMMAVLTGVTLWFERGTGWRLFPFARVLPTVGVLAHLSWSGRYLTESEVWWLVALTVAVALLGLLSALVSPEEPAVGQSIALGLLVAMSLPAMMAPRLLQDPAVAGSVLGVLAVLFTVVGSRARVHTRVRAAAVPLGAGFLLLAAVTLTTQAHLGVVVFVLACVYLAVAARTRSLVSLVVGSVLAAIGLLDWSPSLLTVFDAKVASAAGAERIAQSVAGIAAIVLAALACVRRLGERRRWLIYVPWALAVLLASVALIHAGAWLGLLAGDVVAGFQIGQAATTVAWTGLCVLFLQRGLAAQEDANVWLHLALATSALAVAKLFLFDLAILDAIARVAAFLAAGLLLLFVGTRYAKAWERAHGGRDAGAAVPSPAVPPVPAAGAASAATPAPDGEVV